jgi:hypothetical protein
MQTPPEIILLQGFCGLSFGADTLTASAFFGEPEEVQTLKDEILGNSSLVYHYWSMGYSLFFDENNEQRFSSVEIDNKDASLFQVKVFSLREKDMVALLKDNGFPLTDTEVHQWGEKRVSFDTAGLDCYYENNRLVSLNFGMPEPASPFSYFPN